MKVKIKDPLNSSEIPDETKREMFEGYPVSRGNKAPNNFGNNPDIQRSETDSEENFDIEDEQIKN